MRLVYVGNDHFQTTEKMPDDSPCGADYWSCYIPKVITKRMGLYPVEHQEYEFELKPAQSRVARNLFGGK